MFELQSNFLILFAVSITECNDYDRTRTCIHAFAMLGRQPSDQPLTHVAIFKGCKTGFEPATAGTTIRCVYQFHHLHHNNYSYSVTHIFYMPVNDLCETWTLHYKLERLVSWPLDQGALLFSHPCGNWTRSPWDWNSHILTIRPRGDNSNLL